MKKYIIGLVVLVSLIGITASANVILKKIEIAQKDYVGIIYGGIGEIRVYEMKMASSTCYVSIDSTRINQHDLSCIR